MAWRNRWATNWNFTGRTIRGPWKNITRSRGWDRRSVFVSDAVRDKSLDSSCMRQESRQEPRARLASAGVYWPGTGCNMDIPGNPLFGRIKFVRVPEEIGWETFDPQARIDRKSAV